MIKSKAFLPVVLGAMLFVSQVAFAVEFGTNSAKITNPYLPLKIGDWQFQKGIGPNYNNRIVHIHAIGTETVSGAVIDGRIFNNVKTLKTNIIVTDEKGSDDHQFLTFSFAQDTKGNVWLMKIYSHMDGFSTLLGGENFKSMFMPAVPTVGLPAGIKMPENRENYCRIVQTGINSLTTTSGTYDNCIEANCYDDDPSDIDVEYYCFGVGIVRTTNEATPSDYLDLKIYGTASDDRVTVIPLGD